MTNEEPDLTDQIVATINRDVQAEVVPNHFDRSEVAVMHMPDLDGKALLLGYLNDALTLSGKTGFPCALALVKLANLDDISTIYGPASVLEIETHAATSLRKTLRLGDNCVNLGHGIFAVLLQNCPAEALKVTTLRLATIMVENPITFGTGLVQLNVQVGGASSALGAAHAAEFLEFAEMALSRAGGALHQCYVLNDPERLRSYFTGNARHVSEIYSQLKSESMGLRLDPVWGAKNGLIKSYIATLDLPRPPLEVRVAQLSGLNSALSLRSIALCLETLSADDTLHLELPLSGQQIFDAQWQAQFFTMLDTSAQVCPRLTLSFDENLMQLNLAGLSILLVRLQGLGCQLGLFGFVGTASNFAMAQSLPVHKVNFIAGDASYDSVTAAQVALAKNNGWLCGVSEISNQSQVERYKALGFDCMSGQLWESDVLKAEVAQPMQISLSEEFETSLAQLREVLLSFAPTVEKTSAIAA